MRMLHNRKGMAALALGLVLLAGCGGAAKVPQQVQESSLIVGSDGSMTAHIVDVFDKNYYNLNDLKTMAEDELKTYISSHPADAERIALKGVGNVENTQSVIVTYTFKDAEVYRDYTGADFFFGTVEEAQKAGYDFGGINQVLYGVSKDKSIVTDNLTDAKMTKKHVLLISERTHVYCPYKVGFISESAGVAEDGSIDTTGAYPEDYPVIIVLDK